MEIHFQHKTHKHIIKHLENCKCIKNINAKYTLTDKIKKQIIVQKHIAWERRNDSHKAFKKVIDS